MLPLVVRMLMQVNYTTADQAKFLSGGSELWCEGAKGGKGAMSSLTKLSELFVGLSTWQRWKMILHVTGKETKSSMSDRLFGDIHIGDPVHIATPKEISDQFQLVKIAIKEFRPKVITVGRSVVDAYLPIQLWPLIEWGLLSTLKATYGNIVIRWDRGMRPPPPPSCPNDLPQPCEL
mmetsp:Transcript_13795/g.32629  ORF Transcript_13795/g.32629 Transcript_13795/m.32629 type:complete len:177 (+) Transcript_13795:86-616(+)